MKKLLFNTLALFLLLAFATVPVEAQKRVDLKAVVDAFDSTVVKYNGQEDYLEQLADMLCKQHDNNAEVLTGIANAFFRRSAVYSERARQLGNKYIDLALAKRKQYVPAYIVKGNTYMSENYPDSILRHGYGLSNDIDSALYWFQRGIDANPQEALGFEEYALAQAFAMTLENYSGQRSEAPVVATLQQYAKFKPDYPVYLKAANLLGIVGWWSLALNCYEKVDMEDMNLEQLREYAELCGEDYTRMDMVTAFGNSKFPSEQVFVRLGMIANRNLADVALTHDDSLKHFSAAKDYWTKLQRLVPDPTENDYIVAAGAYNGLEEYDKAAECYETLLSKGDLKRENLVFSSLISTLSKMGKWDKAAEKYEERIQRLLSEGKEKVAADQYYYYAVLFSNYYFLTDSLSFEENISILQKGDSVMNYAQQHFSEFNNITEQDIYSLRLNNFYGSMMREYYNTDVNINDATTPEGVDFCHRYIALEQQKPQEMERPSGLLRAFKYLAYHYYMMDENKTNGLKCIDYCFKALDMDPEDRMMNNILKTNKIKKYLKYYK
ncbi:MAG: hypothetical protein J5971_00285 [Prevotella sp.]|nr:hypothetical protein [Prevotella sp.]